MGLISEILAPYWFYYREIYPHSFTISCRSYKNIHINNDTFEHCVIIWYIAGLPRIISVNLSYQC